MSLSPMADEDDYYDLGVYSREIKTSSVKARLWFNRGLIWCYGFNHEEAVRCFGRAIDADSDCAMAYWGVAYALGPNYNKPWDVFDRDELQRTAERTHNAVKEATARVTDSLSLEGMLIDALQYRYPKENAEGKEDWSIWNVSYANGMQEVHEAYPDDLDVAALYADAMMNLTPWRLWNLRTGEPKPRARTMQIKAVLERAFALPGGLQHPGLLHLYIHFVEMGPSPEKGIPIADRLRGLVPDAGHLNHMPSHLDILCGDYSRAVICNTDAIKADEKFLKRTGALNFYTLYRAHDYHFKLYAAMFAGQSRVAIETATALERALPEELLRIKSPPMADWLEGFSAMPIHALVRFGRWEEIISRKMPTDQELYCVNTALLHYAKVVAYAAVGQLEAAKAHRIGFDAAFREVPESRTIFNNSCLDILKVAEAMLNGELEYRLGNIDQGLARLRQSIELHDELPYDEPWGWMQPTRHAYGALLLEQGRVQEASAVYCADLGLDDTLPRALQHPNNVWSLSGYHECLTKMGKIGEANALKPQLEKALAIADVPVRSSCFCRMMPKL